MNSCVPSGNGFVWQGIQCNPPYYPTLPPPIQGIGIYWQEQSHTVDWDAPGYPTRIIQDPSGTILLAENADGCNVAGGGWFCVCMGPTNYNPGVHDDLMYQLDSGDPQCYGSFVYAAHGMKFPYLFHDNHVSILSWQQTLGTTPAGDIRTAGIFYGMWTVKAGD